MTLWGMTTADSTVGYLGTAIVMNNSHPSIASEDSLHWIMAALLKKKTMFTYYTGAGWTLSGDFTSDKDWTAYVERFSELVKQPLFVTIGKN